MKVITNGFLNKSNSKLYNYRTKFWEKYLEDNHITEFEILSNGDYMILESTKL